MITHGRKEKAPILEINRKERFKSKEPRQKNDVQDTGTSIKQVTFF